MLFITNRALKEGKHSTAGREINFDLKDNSAGQSIFCAERKEKGEYVELGSANFFQALKDKKSSQLLFYIHGYNTLPERAFRDAEKLQDLFNREKSELIEVVPIIWPCDNDFGVIKDYYDDQHAADASGLAFARAILKLLEWQAKPEVSALPCLKRLNILAHSMGNRVLRSVLTHWKWHSRELSLLFRNLFLVAADIENCSLNEDYFREANQNLFSTVARNVSVYYATDDRAMIKSRKANSFATSAGRLGQTGPMMDKVAHNVYAIDCDDFNNDYDPDIAGGAFGDGHTYFMHDGSGQNTGKCFEHICNSVITGRVDADNNRRKILL